MTSQTGQIITIQTLSNITRSKGNQTIKFNFPVFTKKMKHFPQLFV